MALRKKLTAESNFKYFLHSHKIALVLCHLVVSLLTISSVDSIASGVCVPYTGLQFSREHDEWYCYNASTKMCQQENVKLVGGRKYITCFPWEEMCIWQCMAPHVCHLEKEGGRSTSGATKQLMYYFNNRSRTCELFLYKGIGGNENKFEKMHDCEVTCMGLPCVTLLSPEPEYCDQTMELFYYDTYSGKCLRHNRCNRLGSNFNSMTDCQQTCQLRLNAVTSPKTVLS
uniref:Pancreatic trypsin inhibitor n=1 Tax=Rhipicephalus zambeziensis TaxID=60191 RepID=A0A224YBE6_9ACAR